MNCPYCNAHGGHRDPKHERDGQHIPRRNGVRISNQVTVYYRCRKCDKRFAQHRRILPPPDIGKTPGAMHTPD